MPNYVSPDIPIWRSAKAAGRTGLLTKDEANAYAEIEYVQAHLEEMEAAKNTARRAVKSFNREFPPLANGDPEFANASSDDLHTYLRLLTTAYETIDAYIHWLRIIGGAESAIVDRRIRLVDIYASERKFWRWRLVEGFYVTREGPTLSLGIWRSDYTITIAALPRSCPSRPAETGKECSLANLLFPISWQLPNGESI